MNYKINGFGRKDIVIRKKERYNIFINITVQAVGNMLSILTDSFHAGKGAVMVREKFIMKPKNDFCFKELMSDEKVRQGFISALLGVKPCEIQKTTLLPTLLDREDEKDKLGILDVRVSLADGIQMDIEMQVLPFEAWTERSLFYLCKMYAGQIKKGEPYESLRKCIHVGILDFKLFDEEEGYYSRFHIWEDSRREKYSDKLEIHLLELPKLAGYENPKDEVLRWAKFFNAETEEEFEMLAKEDEYIETAYGKVLKMSANERKRLKYEARQKAIMDHRSLIEGALRKGRRQGLQQGLQQGLEQGLQAGLESVVELLEECGTVPDELRERIMKESDPGVLKRWIRIAAGVNSVEEFEKKMK